MAFSELFEKYDRLVLFDTETTGLQFARDEIIEFAAVVVEQVDGEAKVVREYDELVTLTPGNTVPPMIQKLTGISTQDILDRGIPKAQVCADIADMFRGNTLLIAYNAHFDLSFLFYVLLRSGDPTALKGKDKLDLLTVFKDRRSYPHKLCNAIEAYGLSGKVVNSHRAVDDVLATVAVMEASTASPSAPLHTSPSPMIPPKHCTKSNRRFSYDQSNRLCSGLQPFLHPGAV